MCKRTSTFNIVLFFLILRGKLFCTEPVVELPRIAPGNTLWRTISHKAWEYDSSVCYYHPPKFSSCGAKSPGFDSGPAHFLIYCCVLHDMRSSGMEGVTQRAQTHVSVTNKQTSFDAAVHILFSLRNSKNAGNWKHPMQVFLFSMIFAPKRLFFVHF